MTERLTEINEFGNADIIGVDTFKLFGNLKPTEFLQASNALDKLAHYEDLEEQGRLIELPCAVGDTVWIIAPNYYKCNNRYNCEDYNPEEYLISWCQKNCSNGYQGIGTVQCVIYGIETYNDENSVQIYCLLDVNGNHYRYSIKDIFLTKEEAEAKLMRGEQE